MDIQCSSYLPIFPRLQLLMETKDQMRDRSELWSQSIIYNRLVQRPVSTVSVFQLDKYHHRISTYHRTSQQYFLITNITLQILGHKFSLAFNWLPPNLESIVSKQDERLGKIIRTFTLDWSHIRRRMHQVCCPVLMDPSETRSPIRTRKHGRVSVTFMQWRMLTVAGFVELSDSIGQSLRDRLSELCGGTCRYRKE